VHRPSVWAGAIALVILSVILAVRLLGDRLYEYPANPELSKIPSDAAIVCLAGGKLRIHEAYTLFSQGVGSKLFIIGAGKRSTALGLAKVQAPEVIDKISPERFAQIQVETESRNTIENAFAVSRLLQQNPELKRIVLLTSAYHMRRAQVVIEHQVHSSIEIIPFTPPSELLAKGTWWHSWFGIDVTMAEYFKFLMASLLAPQLGYF
jgi:uncharacterized SAM-binding protein YcdF (DUF218 family)